MYPLSLYVGCDLHANHNFVEIIGEGGDRVCKGKLPDDAERIPAVPRLHQEDLAGIVVESNYNWCWVRKDGFGFADVDSDKIGGKIFAWIQRAPQK
jgi:hypothetical protein